MTKWRYHSSQKERNVLSSIFLCISSSRLRLRFSNRDRERTSLSSSSENRARSKRRRRRKEKSKTRVSLSFCCIFTCNFHTTDDEVDGSFFSSIVCLSYFASSFLSFPSPCHGWLHEHCIHGLRVSFHSSSWYVTDCNPERNEERRKEWMFEDWILIWSLSLFLSLSFPPLLSRYTFPFVSFVSLNILSSCSRFSLHTS